MKEYLNLLAEVMDEGHYKRPARPGMPATKELFCKTVSIDCSDGTIPLLTTKKVSFNNILTELLWFLKGDTNIKYLVDHGCKIWNDDAYRYYQELGGSLSKEEWLSRLGQDIDESGFVSFITIFNGINNMRRYGDCGMLYGANWRNFNYDGFDQIVSVINNLRMNPTSRYHIVTGWNPNQIGHKATAALPACHMLFQCNVRQGSYLDLMFLQRSCDLFLGVPYNWASYAILLHLLAALTGLEPGDLIWVGNSVHIYENQMEAVEIQLERIPGTLPKLVIDNTKINSLVEMENIPTLLQELCHEDFNLIGYNPQGAIKAPLSTGTVRK